jgi:hypothetical protein
MNSKISNWLLIQDEKFWSMIKDESRRKRQLEQLYRLRTQCIFLSLFVLVLLVVVAIIGGQDSPILFALFLLVGQMFIYFEADSRIRTIRLYELLIVAN